MAVLTEEQSMLRDAAKSWVQEKSPVTAFRKMRDSGAELGYDVAAWNEMAEMGWAGVIVVATTLVSSATGLGRFLSSALSIGCAATGLGCALGLDSLGAGRGA